ncbi:MAG: signal peptidase I [Traorella sp.]
MSEKLNHLMKEIWDFIKLFIFWFLIFLVITKFFVNPIQVIGNSMYPTLIDQERGFSSIISRNFEIKRFDIVVVEEKGNGHEHWVKRVIGLPNETIECKDDVIYINNEPIDQSFLDEEWVENEKMLYGCFTSDFGPYTLKEDEYFLLGDNRTHSTDSRVVGPFSKDEITSVGVFVYFPFQEFGIK